MAETGSVSPSKADHWTKHIPDKIRGSGRDRRAAGDLAGDLGRHLDLVQVDQGLVHGGVVLLDDGFAAFAVGLLDGLLDLLNGFITRQDAGDGEEAGLHDGVDAATHAGLFGHIVGVDGVELEFLLDDILLDFLAAAYPRLPRGRRCCSAGRPLRAGHI